MATTKTHRALMMRKIEGKPGEVWYPLQLESIPTPTPNKTQLLLRPTHVALNHRDLFMRQHLYPFLSFTVPLLADGVCEVIAHPASARPSAGKSDEPERVLLNPSQGWIDSPFGPEDSSKFAILGGTTTLDLGTAQELLLCDAAETVACPAHLTGPEAAALPLVGLTAWRALVTKSGAASPGSRILITGIGGGVALMALLFAVKMGLEVWVSSGDEAKITRAKELGAKGGISYKEKSWEKTLKSLVGKGVEFDSVIDGAGGDIVEKATKLLKVGGTVVSYGMTLAPRISMPMSAVLRNIEVRGSTMGSRQEFRDMVAFVARERVRPIVSRVVSGGLDNLDGLESLFEDMKAGRQFGKLVLAMQPEESVERSKL